MSCALYIYRQTERFLATRIFNQYAGTCVVQAARPEVGVLSRNPIEPWYIGRPFSISLNSSRFGLPSRRYNTRERDLTDQGTGLNARPFRSPESGLLLLRNTSTSRRGRKLLTIKSSHSNVMCQYLRKFNGSVVLSSWERIYISVTMSWWTIAAKTLPSPAKPAQDLQPGCIFRGNPAGKRRAKKTSGALCNYLQVPLHTHLDESYVVRMLSTEQA